MMDKMPERIRAWRDEPEDGYPLGFWTESCKGGPHKDEQEYLPATPLLEHAGEMRDVLKEVIVGVNIDESCTCFVCKAGRLLASIEKAEGERGGG